MKLPKWQMHRGYWKGGVRENTLSAFIEAGKLGAEMVELDVQLSREGVPHVFHDESLKKFFHVDKKVSQVSSDDLQALNVPTLESVLHHPEVPSTLNVELKSLDLWPRRLSRQVGELLQTEHGKSILLSSFNPMCLHWYKRALPEYPRALLIGHPEALFDWKFSFSLRLAQPQYIHAHFKLVDDRDCRERLLSFGLPLVVWTVNDYEKARLYLERGALSVISDLPPPPA